MPFHVFKVEMMCDDFWELMGRERYCLILLKNLENML